MADPPSNLALAMTRIILTNTFFVQTLKNVKFLLSEFGKFA
jgi:hypothetical protein